VAKLTRESVVSEALDLLDEVGLDAVSTRLLARRLTVEQPSLYWHFRKKSDLLAAMAAAAMAPLASAPLPAPTDDWQEWLSANTREFRRTLLLRRDGARLHAGLLPADGDLERALHKVSFLTRSGVPERDAQMAMLAASRFTVGSVLEQQADADFCTGTRTRDADVPEIGHDMAFEAGLALIVEGLAARVHRTGTC
jgi:TetR/AcrR family tetracycline transcriptional repressor